MKYWQTLPRSLIARVGEGEEFSTLPGKKKKII